MILKYSYPAPLAGEDARACVGEIAWERYSLPLGNGFFGANVFGRTEIERIQISEPSLTNPYYTPKNVPRKGCSAAGVNSFADIFLDFGHKNISDYRRTLSLEEAVSTVDYQLDGVKYHREAFTSHPDKILALHISADKPRSVSFSLRASVPFIGDYTVEEGDGLSKDGKVTVSSDGIAIEGSMGYYGIEYFGFIKVIPTGGCLTAHDGQIVVSDADSATVLFSCDSNYILDESVFLEDTHQNKLHGRTVDRSEVLYCISSAASLSYSELKARHIKDYRSLYSRTSLSLCADDGGMDTDQLVQMYSRGERSLYLESLLFQYGRYLLISSSRTRLPAHLQGIWNAYCDSPWSAGYWHNINVQMNYWPSGPAGLSETFIPYINYAKAYMPLARRHADRFIQANYPEKCSDNGQNGWIIGTGAYPYTISGFMQVGHSGPGTGAFTSLLFWDYYDFSRDKDFLRDFGYPALREMSLFFSKVLVKIGDKYLIRESASPENVHNGSHYHTVGCAFDQQMVYENMKRTIEAAQILGESDDFIDQLKEILPHLDPVLLGDDGQVKEYREETTYSSIGDPHHRHISHLVGLYPGTIINDQTPEWIEGARVTLTKRGDMSTCWAAAHRLLLWARTKTPSKCRDIINSFISRNVLNNLWCYHPPFQIDGNFGYTAGVCEMLLQSQSGYIELLPSIPTEWESGSFRGIVARGNFSVDCRWEKGKIIEVAVVSKVGGTLRIKLPDHLIPPCAVQENGACCFDTVQGQTLRFAENQA